MEPCGLLLKGEVTHDDLQITLQRSPHFSFCSSVFHSVLNGVVNAVEKTKTEEELRVGQGFTKEVT